MNTVWVEIPVLDPSRAEASSQSVFEHAPTEVLAEDARRITLIEAPRPSRSTRPPGSSPPSRARCAASTSTAPSPTRWPG
jgi:hypothetical protein